MKKAFTLAEVLITLAVIGVVAALAIPGLMQNTQDSELKTAWKKAYSNIAQATKMIMLDSGSSMKDLCTDWDSLCLKNHFSRHLSYTKVCNNVNETLGNCWHNNDGRAKYLNGTPINGSIWDWCGTSNPSTGFILSNGSLLLLMYRHSNGEAYGATGQRFGMVQVDVNGFKPPNTVGKDIFGMEIFENTIVPDGKEIDSCLSSSRGWGCSAKYLME